MPVGSQAQSQRCNMILTVDCHKPQNNQCYLTSQCGLLFFSIVFEVPNMNLAS